MCATCAVTDAARAKDWDEVARLAAREQKKTEEEAQADAAVNADDDVKAEKTTSKAGAK
jgi:hypothetical protein